MIAEIRNDVKNVEILLLQIGCTAARLKSFTIVALDGGSLSVSNWYGGYDEVTPYAQASPAVGWKANWAANTIVRNYAPANSWAPWAWRYWNPTDGFQTLMA